MPKLINRLQENEVLRDEDISELAQSTFAYSPSSRLGNVKSEVPPVGRKWIVVLVGLLFLLIGIGIGGLIWFMTGDHRAKEEVIEPFPVAIPTKVNSNLPPPAAPVSVEEHLVPAVNPKPLASAPIIAHQPVAMPATPPVVAIITEKAEFAISENTIGMHFVRRTVNKVPLDICQTETLVKHFRRYVESEKLEIGPMESLLPPEADGTGQVWRTEQYSWKHPEWMDWYADAYGDDHPVVGVSFADAEEFCHWLNTLEKDSLEKENRVYRLPMLYEWRALVGDVKQYLRKKDTPINLAGSEVIQEKHWPFPGRYFPNHSDPWLRTAPAIITGSEIVFLIGNVAEWCDTPNEQKVAVGGSWYSTRKSDLEPEFLDPATRSSRIGFRVVKVPKL